MSAIYILWLRQLKRYFRSRSRMIGSLGQPLMFLLALGFGLGPMFQKSGGGSYLQFIAPGIIAMGVLFSAVFSGMEIIWDRQFGFLKETLVAPVSRIKIILGRILGGATVALIQGILVLVICFIVGFRVENLMLIPVAVVFMFLIAILCAAIGTVIASVLDDMQGFQLIMNFLVMPTFFLSGALFPLTNLPPVIEWLTRINPLSYGVDGIRGALTGVSQFGIGLDSIVLVGATLIVLWIGQALFSKIQA